jgi:hypothetical protein
MLLPALHPISIFEIDNFFSIVIALKKRKIFGKKFTLRLRNFHFNELDLILSLINFLQTISMDMTDLIFLPNGRLMFLCDGHYNYVLLNCKRYPNFPFCICLIQECK